MNDDDIPEKWIRRLDRLNAWCDRWGYDRRWHWFYIVVAVGELLGIVLFLRDGEWGGAFVWAVALVFCWRSWAKWCRELRARAERR